MAVDVAEFFERVWRLVAEAEQAAGESSDRWFEIADYILKIRFIGTSLQQIVCSPLSHLSVESPSRSPDLTVYCWDCRSLGLAFPKSPVPFEAFTPRGEVHGLNDARFHVSSENGVLSLMDTHLRQAVYCHDDAPNIARSHVAEPLKAILSWFMRENGHQLLHAGAVGTPDGGVLLIGRSGAGKSNTSLGSLTSDLSYASDDFCAVSTRGHPQVYSLYSTGKTHERDWSRHPFLAKLSPNLDPARLDKAIYFLNDAMPQKLIRNFPLRAIFVLRKGGQTCSVQPIPPVTVLRLTAADTAHLLPDAGAEVMRCWAHLVRSVPCYELLLGPAPEVIPGFISRFLIKPLSFPH